MRIQTHLYTRLHTGFYFPPSSLPFTRHLHTHLHPPTHTLIPAHRWGRVIMRGCIVLLPPHTPLPLFSPCSVFQTQFRVVASGLLFKAAPSRADAHKQLRNCYDTLYAIVYLMQKVRRSTANVPYNRLCCVPLKVMEIMPIV